MSRLLQYQESYDTVAAEYVRRIFDELKAKPLDRQLLEEFARAAGPLGPLCDIGCGPGHVAADLKQFNVDVLGVDLSPEMIRQAGTLTPGIPFHVGNMLALDFADDVWGGIAAFYSIIHLPTEELPQAFREFHRVLRPGGLALIAFHLGEKPLHLQDYWGHKVDLDFFYHRRATVNNLLESAGFAIKSSIEREPYPGAEAPTRRAYILAQKKPAWIPLP